MDVNTASRPLLVMSANRRSYNLTYNMQHLYVISHLHPLVNSSNSSYREPSAVLKYPAPLHRKDANNAYVPDSMAVHIRLAAPNQPTTSMAEMGEQNTTLNLAGLLVLEAVVTFLDMTLQKLGVEFTARAVCRVLVLLLLNTLVKTWFANSVEVEDIAFQV
jgi:hypothetical protein